LYDTPVASQLLWFDKLTTNGTRGSPRTNNPFVLSLSKGVIRLCLIFGTGSYNDPGYIGRRHKIKGLNDTLDNISSALNNFATAAAH
jgi:hypothetical protein